MKINDLLTREAFRSETLARDIAVTRLKPTGIPRSPGGTTLIPQRRPASKPPTATEEACKFLNCNITFSHCGNGLTWSCVSTQFAR
ncbi:hypothetical protein BC832DRAFT_215332 [Gaertneriomyces semiglobifer]|nr:hypothetical protein BC832DRAFT_215332 [Gaertneriomyces semiglobifer]